ncbi:malonate transporter [Amylibacter marinus]|uniref:Malonate transporter n=1 Tax=Amylibacter marinus TaxID=1475483 RepID=A0ABQ5VRT1_9RHOB|nr:AEC family transporter [Amylibacter marinus]GLQ33967.1 malonate transporter [Amylibacter marinus]
MFEISQIILPVFFIIALGYGARWRGSVDDQQSDTLAYFAQNFAIPALLFNAVAHLNLREVFNAPLFVSYYLPALVVFLLGMILARAFFKRTAGQSVSIGFTGLFSNTVLLGLPIMELAFGPASMTSNYALISVHVPFCYTIGITCMEILRADGAGFWVIIKAIGRAIFKNTLAMALIAGFAFNFSGLVLPEVVERALDMMVRAALPVALFSLGAVLFRYKLTNNLPEVAMVSVLKLLLFPALAYVMATHVFNLPDMVRNSVVITAAMPPGINTYIFANIYNRGKATAASSVVIATFLSIFTISAWLALLT